MTKEELAEEYFDKECLHSYADNEEELKEDVIAAFLAGAEPREKRIEELEKENRLLGERCNQLLKDKSDLTDEVRMLKILVSSLVYEINQIWDINEMNDDLRMCAEKIDREVQLSKMAEDNRMVISALGFAIVPPKPKLVVKEI
jgi:hypothetical protein